MKRAPVRGAALSLLLFIGTAGQSGAAQPFQFGSIVFSDDVQVFLEENGANWSYNYARNLPAPEAFRLCQQRLEAEGLQNKSYISSCFFRSSTNPYFSGMHLHARVGVLYRVLLNFKNNQDRSKILRQLENSLGQPNRRGRYYEEAFLHNLTEWKKDGYRVVLDIGGVDELAPVHLVYETMPVFPGGFNPPMLILEFLSTVE